MSASEALRWIEPDPPLIRMRRIQKERYEDEKRFETLFRRNDKYFSVMLSDRPLPGFDVTNCIGAQYLTRLDNCGWDGGIEDEPEDADLQYDRLYEEIEDLLRTHCQPFFQELAPDLANKHQPKNLHTHLYPDVFNLSLETLAGKPKIVQLNGEVMVCKLTNEPGDKDSLAREYTSLKQILNANIAASIKVPNLRGVVLSEEGRLAGILLDYIQPAIPDLGIALHESDIETSRRKKWASQIDSTLEQLHNIGVIWGDAKTSNVLIDEKDDAWILDIGGGHTIGWVPVELYGTKEGDLAAFGKILGSLRE